MRKFTVILFMTLLVSCAGMKVVNPEDPATKNAGTKMFDASTGKFVSTYTCQMLSSAGRVSAIGKTEEEARNETLARCKDRTVISVCNPEKISCSKN